MLPFTESSVKHPELFDYDVVSIGLMDDPDWIEQIQGTYDYKPSIWNDNDFDSALIDDAVCGDSIEFLDREADEYIESYNNIHDGGDGELIDLAIGLNPD